MSPTASLSPLLTCLVPVRNGAGDLPGFLASVRRCCDAVVALDDGSIDNTHDILHGSDLVKVLLRNPRRETYHGWNDYLNRKQLLEASTALLPRWLLWVDADERIPSDEAVELRRFVETSAREDHAYGFRVFPLRDDLSHYEERFLWVYRLFHSSRQQTLDDRRLHLFPVPLQIPASRWIRTTFRLQHLGGLTAERRRQRYEKYRQADPRNEFQSDYTSLLREPHSMLPQWEPRPRDQPFVWQPNPSTGQASRPVAISFFLLMPPEGANAQPLLSDIHEMLARADVPSHELFVLADGLLRGSINGVALNRALAEARGDVICLLMPHVEFLPGSLRVLVEAHQRGFPMVTGCKPGGGFSTPPTTPTTESGGVVSGTPEYCSWHRAAILEVGGFPSQLSISGADFNEGLMRAGFHAYWTPDVRLRITGSHQPKPSHPAVQDP